MAKGTWSEKEKPQLPGFYNRFKTRLAEENSNSKGILAMPVKANWGPIGKAIKVTERELKEVFGEDYKYSVTKLGKLAFLGGVKHLLLYRLADDSHKTGKLNLKDASSPTGADVIELQTKYSSSRKFNVTIKNSVVDPSKKELIIFEETKQLCKISNLKGTIDEIVSLINNNTDNVYVTATKIKDSDNGLAAIVNQSLTGGNDGCSNITNQAYIDALSEFERHDFDAFTLDLVSDSVLQLVVKEWIIKNETEGKDIAFFTGIKVNEDITLANEKSREYSHEYITNLGQSAYYKGIKYTPFEVSVYIAALGVSQPISGSICNQKTIFEDIEPRLSREELKNCLNAGTLVLDVDDGDVIVVDDKNTFTKYTEEKGENFGYIRAINFRRMVNKVTSLKRKDFVGKVINDSIGQTTILVDLKKIFEDMLSLRIISDFTVEIDEKLQSTAKPNEFFWRWNAKYIDILKNIYGTGYIE